LIIKFVVSKYNDSFFILIIDNISIKFIYKAVFSNIMKHKTIQNLILIENQIKNQIDNSKLPKIIAVSKTFKMENILPLIKHGHLNFGENKVQEAVDKWSEEKNRNQNIKLHMVGKLQTNKVKLAVKLFDYIHSVDTKKLAKKISEEQNKINKDIKVFIQINIGNEIQKSGISKDDLVNFYNYCKEINLNVIGLMCLPPSIDNSSIYFKEMELLSKKVNLHELSMGMSSDYLIAANNFSTYLRIGTGIFGARS
jgi:PLP dependent protein